MNKGKAIQLQSGDDETIEIKIGSSCIPLDFGQYDAYWELKKTLSSQPVLAKTSLGSQSLPAGVTPDVLIDYTTNIVSVSLASFETAPLLGEWFQVLSIKSQATGKKTSITYGVVNFLESTDSIYEAISYTTPELVSIQLRLTDSDGGDMIFTENTDPKRSTVIKYIKQAEATIDRDTRNSWRTNYVTQEMHDISFPLAGLPLRDVTISLRKAYIKDWDSTEGDSLQIMKGGQWIPYPTPNVVQGNSGWWIDRTIGQIHINDFWPWFYSGSNKVAINYRWGQDWVPDDITEACTMMVAIRLLESEFNKIMLYNRQSNPINWGQVIQNWTKKIEKIMANHRRKVLSVVTR